jgi:hypothetical protein
MNKRLGDFHRKLNTADFRLSMEDAKPKQPDGATVLERQPLVMVW